MTDTQVAAEEAEGDQGNRSSQTMTEPVTEYSIVIRSCNSIDEATLSIRKSALNIKYGSNGVGKSTIARALTLNMGGEGDLTTLLPFKLRGDKSSTAKPSVTGADNIRTVLTFDEAYVSGFAFKADEVVQDSFEIFINTDEFQAGLLEIETLFKELKEALNDQAEFTDAIGDLYTLHKAFAVTKTGTLSRASTGFKALAVGGALANIPEPLVGYSGFIRGESPAEWVRWQASGKAYLDVSDNCPFCSIPNVDKQKARKVSEVYESALVKNMTALRSAISRLGKYFSPTSLALLEEVTGSLDDPTVEQSAFLVELHNQVETFLSKLTALREMSFSTLRDVDDIEAQLGTLTINLKFLAHLDSEATQTVVDVVNAKVTDTRTKINDIQRELGTQRARVKKLIEANQRSINEFLESAGYLYKVRIEAAGDSYRMILEHRDATGHISNAATHLSYGERNAFALVLFMHQVRHDKPDLVVLDDPVSSFDKSKKFAIFHRLFKGSEGLRGSTTLLLTHDIEPVIDMLVTGTKRHFEGAEPVAHFLHSKIGTVTEQPVARSDVESFSDICRRNLETSTSELIQCIYLRRLLEVTGDSDAAYAVLSNLLHGREVPTDKLGSALESGVLEEARTLITKHIPGYDYDRMVKDRRNLQVLRQQFVDSDASYERLQITRMVLELEPKLGSVPTDDALMKFINESYHIENEYLMQLDPRKFDSVPEYVRDACSKLVLGIPETAAE
ncbi:AAA family ATPase [Demequina sp.]|uniref:AAA family ATPase n=1 Tax=Demequina sp. TaxID=2050685 RepID=UPI003D0B5B1B